ncbi:type II toxin-antitoxin system RelE/ParE family toxin [Microbacterium sp. MYb45]|uniref:type II toxin-antitoxin system RelE/ParE family toxin n=1 Tax=Microbacterium sp. MYb45 TaxID=1827294 RepID=UPI0011B01D83|nr:type II toxin-antitoxin system RelE/ParE family toxin [Microbacterium sp. MYb45]
MWKVVDHPEATSEYSALNAREAVAIDNAVAKLRVVGASLGYPHTSDVKNTQKLRELRPRAGRSPVRAFYRQIGDTFVIGAYGPEAESNPKGFKRACEDAVRRLNQITVTKGPS